MEDILEKIVKIGSKWQVQSEKGRNMGTYDTKAEAEERLRQVHYFKYANEDLDLLDEDYRKNAIEIADKEEWNKPIELIDSNFIIDPDIKSKYIAELEKYRQINGGRFTLLATATGITKSQIQVHHIVFRDFGQKILGLDFKTLDNPDNLIALTATQHLSIHNLLKNLLIDMDILSPQDEVLKNAASNAAAALAQHAVDLEDLTNRQIIAYLKATYLDASNAKLANPDRGNYSIAPGHYIIIDSDGESKRVSLDELADILDVNIESLKKYLNGESNEEIETKLMLNDVSIKKADQKARNTAASPVLLIKTDLVSGDIRALNRVKDILTKVLNSNLEFAKLTPEEAHNKLMTDGWCWFPTKTAAQDALGRVGGKGKAVGELVNKALDNFKNNKWFDRRYALGDIWDDKRSTDYKFYALPADEASLTWMKKRLQIQEEEALQTEALLEDNRTALVNKSRNVGMYKDQSRGKNRFERKRYSKIANTVKQYNQIDMNKLFKQDTLQVAIPVVGETDNYTVTIKMEGVINELARNIKANNNKLEYKTIIQALTKIFNTANLYVKCNCSDYKYRFAHWNIVNNVSVDDTASDPGPGKGIRNPKDEDGRGCKHVLLALANGDWLMKVASVINNYIHYAEEKLQKPFLKVIFPKLYGIEAEEMVEQGLIDDDKYLDSSAGLIDAINEYGKTRGRYKAGMNKNPVTGTGGRTKKAEEAPEEE